jgi:hypothetical protein
VLFTDCITGLTQVGDTDRRIRNWRRLDDPSNIFAEISLICSMKHKFQEPRLSFGSPFLIHREDKSSILARAISIVIDNDTVTMCGWSETSSVIASFILVADIHSTD